MHYTLTSRIMPDAFMPFVSLFVLVGILNLPCPRRIVSMYGNLTQIALS